MVIEMNNRAAVDRLGPLINHHFVQRKRREEKHPSGAHGVVAIIDDRHAKTLFDIQNFQTLMPVVIAHGIGEQAAERHNGIVEGDQLQMVRFWRVAHSAIKLNFYPSLLRYKPPF
ncbi:hypothetical protein D3C85_972400 [compost metagenome]